jgi:hypothetical protein
VLLNIQTEVHKFIEEVTLLDPRSGFISSLCAMVVFSCFSFNAVVSLRINFGLVPLLISKLKRKHKPKNGFSISEFYSFNLKNESTAQKFKN